MTDEQRIKFNVLMDVLLTKTREGKCDWRYIHGNPEIYRLEFDMGSTLVMNKRKTEIRLTLYNDKNIEIAEMIRKDAQESCTGVKLYNFVKAYHDKKTAETLDLILHDLNQLTKDDDPVITEKKRIWEFWK